MKRLAFILISVFGLQVSALATLFNVTNYAAVGDATQAYVNCTSNSVIVQITNTASIGQVFELYGSGTVTVAPNCQDLIATITNVVNGTNVYLNVVPQRTLTGAWANWGHDNQTNIENVIALAGGAVSNVIFFPAGNYKYLGTQKSGTAGYSAIKLYGGGINFIGEGAATTKLIGQGAWFLNGSDVTRGFFIEAISPVTNQYPVTFQNMTIDGGVAVGNTSNHSFPASVVTGDGWDINHDAYIVYDAGGSPSDNTFNELKFLNVTFSNWRGEMLKSVDLSVNGHMTVLNCIFTGGNATALNIYPAWGVTNNLFTNGFQIAEYYQQYATNTSYFVSNTCVGITGNQFSVNGGTGSNSPIVFEGNTFDMQSSLSGNGLQFGWANFCVIRNNTFYLSGGATAIVIGQAGEQGLSGYNSDILINGNTVYTDNNRRFILISDGPDYNIGVTNNVQIGGFARFADAEGNPWSTNVFFSGNTGSFISSGGLGGQWFIDCGNNTWTGYSQNGGGLNQLGYASGSVNGSSYYLTAANDSTTTNYLVNAAANKLPNNTVMRVKNNNGSATPKLFLNENLTGTPLVPAVGETVTFYWNDSAWRTNAPTPIIYGALRYRARAVNH